MVGHWLWRGVVYASGVLLQNSVLPVGGRCSDVKCQLSVKTLTGFHGNCFDVEQIHIFSEG